MTAANKKNEAAQGFFELQKRRREISAGVSKKDKLSYSHPLVEIDADHSVALVRDPSDHNVAWWTTMSYPVSRS